MNFDPFLLIKHDLLINAYSLIMCSADMTNTSPGGRQAQRYNICGIILMLIYKAFYRVKGKMECEGQRTAERVKPDR